MYYLIALTIIFFLLALFFSYVSYKSLEKSKIYEDFFFETSGEISSILNSFDIILKRKELLSEDPDIKNLIKGLLIARDIMSEYVKAAENQKRRS